MANRLQSLRKALLLLVAPALFLVLHALFSEARGPFYLAVNYDPDYAYLLNGLNVVNGNTPEHVDHPGIPLHLFAAGCIKLANIGFANRVTIITVLSHSESYLKGLNAVLMVCYFISLFLFGVLVWRKTGSMAGALLLQASPFLLSDDFFETVRFRPESMILIVAVAMAAMLYILVLRDTRESTGAICLLSFLAATGLVAKINFLPLVILPLFCLRTWRDRAGYIILVCFFAGLWFLPLKPHYERFTAWVLALATRQGRYGTGEAGLIGSQYPQFLAQLLEARPVFFLTIALSLAAVVHTWGWRWDKTGPQERRLIGLLSGLVLAQTVEYLMAGKFGEGRYLVPAIAFCGLNWAVLLALIHYWQDSTITLGRLRWVCWSVGIFIACWSGINLQNLYVQMTKRRDYHSEMAQVLEKDFADRTVVYYYGCSSLYHALWFGNAYAGRRYDGIIENLFPNHSPAYFVEEWPNKTHWYSIAGPDERIERRLKRGETLFLAGQELPWPKSRERELRQFVPTNAFLEIETVRRQGNEAIYQVRALVQTLP